jgi:hypothetical protein
MQSRIAWKDRKGGNMEYSDRSTNPQLCYRLFCGSEGKLPVYFETRENILELHDIP